MGWWSGLSDHVVGLADHIRPEWTFAFAKSGWTLRLYERERVLLYLIPQDRGFLVGIVLGQHAVRKALAAHPTGLLPALLSRAVRAPEGVGLRFPVLSADACRLAADLAGIKLGTA